MAFDSGIVCGDTVSLLVRLSIDAVILEPDEDSAGELGDVTSSEGSLGGDMFNLDVWEAAVRASGLLELRHFWWWDIVRVAVVPLDWLPCA